MLFRTVLASAFIAAAGMASASSINIINTPIPDSDKLFTTETKVDENVLSNQQRGADLFVRPGAVFSPNDNTNVDWVSGTLYDWSLSYDGSIATFTMNAADAIDNSTAKTVSYDVLDGTWNAFKLITRAQNLSRNRNGVQQTLLSSSSTEVTIDEVNGNALTTAYTQSSVLGGSEYVELTLDYGGDAISSIAGTFQFDWLATGDYDSSPNGRLAFIVKAAEVSAVPLPAGASLLLAGLAGFAVMRRRARTV